MTPTLNLDKPRPLRSHAEYDATVAEIDRLLKEDPAPGSAGAERLELLALLVEAYDDKHHVLRPRSTPQSVVLFALEQQGKTRADLAPLLGSKSRVSEFIRGKRRLSLAQVSALRRALGIPADLLIEADRDAGRTDHRLPRRPARVSESPSRYGAETADDTTLVSTLQKVVEQLDTVTSLLTSNAQQMSTVLSALRVAVDRGFRP